MRFLHLVLGVSRLFVSLYAYKSPTSSAFIGVKGNCCHALKKCKGLKMKTDPPSCSDCIHFITEKQTAFSSEKQCRNFIQIDHLTGVITHRDALNCRINDDLCGLDGEYFESKAITYPAPAKTPVVEEYTEEQLVKIRLGLFVCHIVFNTVFWITLIDLLYLHLWIK